MHCTIKSSTTALCMAVTVLAASTGRKSARSLEFTVNQVVNPKYTGSSGVLAMAKTYSKYNKSIPSGLKSAISQQFPTWGEFDDTVTENDRS
jgi:hypothetical protein